MHKPRLYLACLLCILYATRNALLGVFTARRALAKEHAARQAEIELARKQYQRYCAEQEEKRIARIIGQARIPELSFTVPAGKAISSGRKTDRGTRITCLGIHFESPNRLSKAEFNAVLSRFRDIAPTPEMCN